MQGLAERPLFLAGALLLEEISAGAGGTSGVDSGFPIAVLMSPGVNCELR